MATSRLSLSQSWSAGGRITASADTALLVRNTNGQSRVFYALTAGDTAPSFSEELGHIILPYQTMSITLRTGERIWFASEEYDFGITVTEGDA